MDHFIGLKDLMHEPLNRKQVLHSLTVICHYTNVHKLSITFLIIFSFGLSVYCNLTVVWCTIPKSCRKQSRACDWY